MSPLPAPLTDPESHCHSNSHERPAVTTRKRKRDGTATTPPPRRSTGPPRPFNHIPKEIFLGVVHYLQPIDLLQLARTSKQFRAILLSRSTALDWDVAYENIGAPPFPRDVSAPAWTYFLFDHNKCDVCHHSLRFLMCSDLRCARSESSSATKLPIIRVSLLSILFRRSDCVIERRCVPQRPMKYSPAMMHFGF